MNRLPRYVESKRAALRSARNLNRGVKVPDYPLTLYIEVSNVCNYKCAFCGSFSALNPKRYSVLKEVDRGFIDLEESHAHLDELIENALTVYLFGFGEPTLHPQFADLVRHVSELETQIEFVTNGLGIDETLARLLVEERVRKINVSFSGATKSDYENVYLGGDFDRVIANIARLASLKREAKSLYPYISINSIAFRHHIARLPEFIDLMGNVGVNAIDVHGLMVFSEFPEMYHHAAVFNHERDGPVLAEARRRAEIHGMLLSTGSFERLVAHSVAEEKAVLRNRASGNLPMPEEIPIIPVSGIKNYARSVEAERPSGDEHVARTVHADIDDAMSQLAISRVEDAPRLYCYEPFRVAYIKKDGHVSPCCLWPENQHSFGDITKTSGRDIWNGSSFNLTRAAMLAGAYPRGCHFCVHSRAAPEDPQLWQATGFIEWYRDGFGIDLSAEFDSQNLTSAHYVTSGLVAAEVPGWSHVASFAQKQYGWEQMDAIAHGVTQGTVEITGYIDRVDADGVCGWSWCPQFPEVNLPLEITADGAVIGTTVAMVLRDDLRSLGLGTGCYGFRLGVPVNLSRPVNVRFRVLGTSFSSLALLFGVSGILGIQCGLDRMDAIAHGMTQGTVEIAGYIDRVDADGVCGWAWCPQFPEVNLPLEIIADDVVIGTTVAMVLRGDLLSLGLGTGCYGFRLGVPVNLSRSVNVRFRVSGTAFSSPEFLFRVDGILGALHRLWRGVRLAWYKGRLRGRRWLVR